MSEGAKLVNISDDLYRLIRQGEIEERGISNQFSNTAEINTNSDKTISDCREVVPAD